MSEAPPTKSEPQPKKKGLSTFAFILWTAVFTIALSEAGSRYFLTQEDGIDTLFGQRLAPLPVLTTSQKETLARGAIGAYYRPDPALGWTLLEGGEEAAPKDRPAYYFANALGLRTAESRPLPDKDREDIRRILLVGDSYTHGDEVPFDDTLGARLESRLGRPFQVWNGGVSGYGTDQAILRFESLHPAVNPKIAILGIYPENLLRNLTLFRPIKHRFTGLPFGKPRFVLKGDALELVHSPVTPPERIEEVLTDYSKSPLARFDSLYEPALYRKSPFDPSLLARYWRSRQIHARHHEHREALLKPSGEAALVSARLAARFVFEARKHEIEPIVLLLPGGPDLASYARGNTPVFAHLTRELERLAITPIDAGVALSTEHFRGKPLSELYVRDGVGHLARPAAMIIADLLIQRIIPR